MATGINYCQHGLLAKAKLPLMFWTQALSHSLRGFSKNKKYIKTVRCINFGCLYDDIFAFRGFKLTTRSRPKLM